MGMADMAVALWGRHLKHNPANPQWADRDRFVLSNGHGSMLIYALLHLTGYDLSIDDLKNFRQLHSKTAGHPEVGITPGVETTTGPLGQGITNAVGLALAEKLLAAEFNRDGHDIVDHHTYVFLGDGCLMEGICHEAASLAGAWKLNKLIALYDDNGISIDGQVTPWFTDNTPQRFEAYGWNVIRDVDGHDVDAVDAAIAEGQAEHRQAHADRAARRTSARARPTAPTPPRRTASPWVPTKSKLTRAALGWTARSPSRFQPRSTPTGIAKANGQKLPKPPGTSRFAAYAKAFPELAAEFTRRMAGDLPANFAASGRGHRGRPRTTRPRPWPAARPASWRWKAFTAALPELLGGSRRPDRLQPDQHQEHARPAAWTPRARWCKTEDGQLAAATSTTVCASSAWPPS